MFFFCLFVFSCTKTVNTTLQKAYKNTVLKKKKTRAARNPAAAYKTQAVQMSLQ